MNRIYAGIGSRKTPPDVLELARLIASAMEKGGWRLRSGGAPGMDTAFQRGVKSSKNKCIYLPSRLFGGNTAGQDGCIDASALPAFKAALVTVDKYHPNPAALSSFGRKLMARNAFQILGPDLKTPADLVICWTPDAKASGGTGQAIRIAEAHGILVVNLENPKHCEAFTQAIEECKRKNKEAAFGEIKLG
jgi:hypothetical protein